MLQENDELIQRMAIVDAHEAAVSAPFWDVLQAADRAALFYGQMRRAGVPSGRARLLSILQFTQELLTQDELSGIRLSRAGYLGQLQGVAGDA